MLIASFQIFSFKYKPAFSRKEPRDEVVRTWKVWGTGRKSVSLKLKVHRWRRWWKSWQRPDHYRELPRWCSGKESICQCRRPKRCGFDPCVRKIPGVRNGNLLRYSCLGNLMDRVAWQATVHGVTKSWAQLSD